MCIGQGAAQAFTLVCRKQRLAGHRRDQLTINGSTPGPTLYVTLGSRVQVQLVNEIPDEATALSFHGQRAESPWMDGAVGLTQCPVGSGERYLYAFTPQHAGTFWYYSGVGNQLVDGLYGALVVTSLEGPGYDEEVLLIADYFQERILGGAAVPVPDAIIVNNAFSGALALSPSPPYASSYPSYSSPLSSSSYPMMRVRVINAAAHSPYAVRASPSGALLRLLEMDGSPVPAPPHDHEDELLSLLLYPGQCASFLLNWSAVAEAAGRGGAEGYLEVSLQAEAYAYPQPQHPLALPLLLGHTSGLPLLTEWRAALLLPSTAEGVQRGGAAAAAADVNLTDPHPVAPPQQPTHYMRAAAELYLDGEEVRGSVNGAAFLVPFGPRPSASAQRSLLQQVMVDRLSPYPEGYQGVQGGALLGDGAHPFVLPRAAEEVQVVQLLLLSPAQGPAQSFSLHGGHRLFVTNTSEGVPDYYGYARDLVVVPAGGWAEVRFLADRPGVWLLHCHLHWHRLGGVGAVLIAAPEALALGYEQHEDGYAMDSQLAEADCCCDTTTTPSMHPVAFPVMPPAPVPALHPHTTHRPSRSPSQSPSPSPSPSGTSSPTSSGNGNPNPPFLGGALGPYLAPVLAGLGFLLSLLLLAVAFLRETDFGRALGPLLAALAFLGAVGLIVLAFLRDYALGPLLMVLYLLGALGLLLFASIRRVCPNALRIGLLVRIEDVQPVRSVNANASAPYGP